MPRLGGAIDLPQVGNPATPAAGRQFLYFKSDGNLYMKDAAGLVSKVNQNPDASTVIMGEGPPVSVDSGTLYVELSGGIPVEFWTT